MNDLHADRRDERWRKKVHGMRVGGRSVLLLAQIIQQKAADEEARAKASRCNGCKSCRWGEIVPCPAMKGWRKRERRG